MLYLSDKLICINTEFTPSCAMAYRFPDGELQKGMVYVLSGFVFGGNEPIRIKITGKRCTSILDQTQSDIGFAPARFVKLSDVKKNPAKYAGVIY